MQFRVGHTKINYGEKPVNIMFKGDYKLSIKDEGFKTFLMMNIVGDLGYTCESDSLDDAELNIDADYSLLSRGWTPTEMMDKNHINEFYASIKELNLLSEEKLEEALKKKLVSMVLDHIKDGRFKEMQEEINKKLNIKNQVSIEF